MISELLDINYVVGTMLSGLALAIVGAVVGLIKWVLGKLELERLKREKDLQHDRHELRNELQLLRSDLIREQHARQSLDRELTFAKTQVEEMKVEMVELRGQVQRKDAEIVKLRDKLDDYTRQMLRHGVRFDQDHP